FSDSDYAGASLDRKSTTGCCQFLCKRLISWQCKKQTVVANSTTEAEYVAAANCCRQAFDVSSDEFGVNTGNCNVNAARQDLVLLGEIDGKTIVISESSMRSDLHFNDEDDVAVFKEWDGRVVRATTSAASLDAAQASGGRPMCQEAIGVLVLEHSKTAQDLVIKKLQKRVKQVEKALMVRTPRMKLFKIGTSRRKSLDKENVSKQGRNDSNKTKELNLSDKGSSETKVFNDTTAEMDVNAAEPVNAAGDIVNATSVIPDVSADCPSTSIAGDIFEDEMTTIADTLIAIRSTRPRTTSVVIRTVKEEPRRATPVPIVQSQDKGKDKMVEPGPTLKNLIKAQIQRDAEIAQRAIEQEAKDAALIKQIEDVQARMDADVLLAERLQQEEREQFTVDEQASMLVDLIVERKRFFMVKESGKKDDDSQKQAESSKKRPRADHDEESAKKQKLEEDDAKKEELRACLDIVPRDDIDMDFESLATKYPIVDWKIHILTENMMYYQIIRADGSSKNYKIFSRMLDDFDRQDVTLFEPSKEDEVWRNQHNYNLISKRLFDSCGVHILLMDTGIAIHMVVENTYTLIQEMLSRMLNRRLEVDHESEMAFELLMGGLLGIRGFYNLMLLVQVCADVED
ncbi:hypothetical protein Tco_0250834, partial [Tanacetum coccineum]